jgi:formyl-CoA transferase
MSTGPLGGVTVLAAEQMHALPHATQLLACMGAEVIKVEAPGGESGRASKPTLRDRDGRETGSTFIRNNLGKSSIAINLKREAGRELFLRLARGVDVVAENFRPGTADRLGIGFDAIRALHPAVVYVSISGFGNRSDPPSPYREWAAYAPIVEGMSGLFEYSRNDDDPPRPALAGALGDTAAGLYASIGVLAALRDRDRTGKGCRVDISMYDSMIAVADVVHPSSMGVEPNRTLEGIGILHAFRAKDGWFTVEVVREPHFPRFATAVGHPEWLEDERLSTRAGWSHHMEDVIRPGVEAWAAEIGKLEAATRLAEAGVASGPVNNAQDIRNDPHVKARSFLHEIETGDRAEPVAVVGNPIAFQPAPPEPREPARWPTVGEHTEQVLGERLGLDAGEIRALREEGCIE